jgi:peptidyl-tRNA hydrolase, PTH1 family
MWLIVGLGNPGRKYDGTRHNVGFDVVEQLAQQHQLSAFKIVANAEVAKGVVSGQEVTLVKPQTFMNLSGDAIRPIVIYSKIPLEQVVVVHDELDFEPGVVRIKIGGGHGGHNGLRSLEAHLGRDFVRVRIGIGKPTGPGVDYVLGKFDSASLPLIGQARIDAVAAIEAILADGPQAAMNKVNRRSDGKIEQGK